MKRNHTKSSSRYIRTAIEKYAKENRDNFEAITKGIELHREFLKQTGIKFKKKIITSEAVNVYKY